MLLFCSIRWKNLRGKRKILQRKVGNAWKRKVKTEKWEVRKKMIPSNKGCEWQQFCSNCLLLYVNTIEVSWQRFSQHHPEHHVKPLPTDNFVEVLLMQWPNLINAVCWTPAEDSLLGPCTKSIICHWQFKEPHGAILAPSCACAGRLCALSTWKVSQALIAEAPCLQPPHEPGAHAWRLRCQLDCSELFSTCCQPQLAQNWSRSVPGTDHPCFEVMMLFTIDFSQLGVKPCSDLHLIKGIFLLSFFSFALQLLFLFFVAIKNMQ